MNLARIIVLTVLLSGTPSSATEQKISGTAYIIDGDTLDISGNRIRLFGIDAPEAKQSCVKDNANWACGAKATRFLKELVEGQKIVCRSYTTDIYGRLVATCNRDGLDLGLTMIEAGLAVSFSNAPRHYIDAEALRKMHMIGIWSSDFQSPAEWRKAHPRIAAMPSVSSAHISPKPARRAAERVYRNKFGCAIKGNRNRRGQWIYHLPGRPYYDQTRPEELFCTESQARKAGYRRSKA